MSYRIEHSKLSKSGWVSGYVSNYSFKAKITRNRTKRGLNGGKISRLIVMDDCHEWLMHYEYKWLFGPRTPLHREIIRSITDFFDHHFNTNFESKNDNWINIAIRKWRTKDDKQSSEDKIRLLINHLKAVDEQLPVHKNARDLSQVFVLLDEVGQGVVRVELGPKTKYDLRRYRWVENILVTAMSDE